MDVSSIIFLGILAAAVMYAVTIYNNLVSLKHAVSKAWANIDVLLKQRHDELPKLIETCKQYMAHEVDHHAYYSQFDRPLVDLVGRVIGVDRIKASVDPHFNDIPLHRWDALHGLILQAQGARIGQANGTGGVSLSDTVCTAKAAARIIREES